MDTQVDFQQAQQQNAKELKRFCKSHPYAECEFLFTDPVNTTESPFKCVMCLFEQSINTKHLIPIKQIERSDDNTILWNWPLPDNGVLLQRVKEVTTGPRSDVRFRDQIGVYFKELRVKIDEKINEIEEATTKQAEKLWNFNAHIASEYNRMSAKEVLKQDVLDLQTDPEKLSIKLRETIASVLASQEQTQRALEKELEEHSLQLSAVDFEGPQRIMESVLAQLGQISMFLVDDLSDLQRQHNPSNDLGNGNAAALYQLATSKMNVVSQEFEERLKQHLLRLKRVWDKTNFGNVHQEGKQRLELELLEEQELTQLQYFAESLIQNKKNPPQTRDKKLWSSELILELLSNPANQCSPDILKQLQEILQSISCYFSQFMIAGEFPQPLDLAKLSNDQLKNIDKLAKKMGELSLVPGYGYSTAISPIPQLQFNSVHSLSWIKNESILKEEQEAEVARVLAQLPVLELLPFNFEKEQNLNWTFEKTNYRNESSYIEITQVQNGSLICQKQNGYFPQAVSVNVLQNELMYEVSCQFNKSFGNSNGNGVYLGLIEEADIHSKYVGYNNGTTTFQYNSIGANTIIRGQQLSASPLKETLTSIHFRFCIQSQELFIFDESKANIVKADPTQIKSTGKYRFGVYINDPGNDYSVTVCNVKAFKDREGIDHF